MKTIIAGGRDINNYAYVQAAMESCPWTPTEVVSGAARGIDTLGEHWARVRKIPIKRFPANWKQYNKAAGLFRNTEMAEYADALVAIWDGKSTGTADMIAKAHLLGLRIHIYRTDDIKVNKDNDQEGTSQSV